MSSYTEENIRGLTGLDIVRTRPNAFLPDREIAGLVHQAVEPIVNSIDEIALMPEGIGILNVLVCLDAARQTYQVVIIDNGRGVPIGSATSLGMVECYTQMHTSGKYDTKAYETSGGLLGMGAKVSVGTSVDARAITHVGERQASLYVHEGEIVGDLKVEPAPSPATGTTMFYEPDPKIFTSIERFGEQGLPRLLLLLQKFCYFRRLAISLRVYHVGLPADIWKRSIKKTDAILQTYWNAAAELFTEPMFDRTVWLKAYWNVQRPFALHHGMKNTFQTTVMENRVPKEVTARYEVQLYTVKFDQVGGRFGMLNNLPIDDHRSTHMASVIDAVKELMSAEIPDKAVKSWFRETYKLAINIAVEIKCPGAEPSGTTKDAFMSSAFRRGYLPSLLATLQSPGGIAFIKAFYAELASDIQDKYDLAMTGVPKVKNANRLFEDLNFPNKYKHCSTTDRSKAELFLVEGNSALNAEGRDSETQGIYAIRGKPRNAIESADKRSNSIKKLLDSDIYQDIIKILNLTPNKFDPTTMFYNRLALMTDADHE